MKNEKRNEQARVELERILDLAAENSADEITLEWCDEGLEVDYVCGDSSVGNIIPDDHLGEAVLGLIVEGADLNHQDPGILRWLIQGQEQAYEVSSYDSFGETAFRLKPLTPENVKTSQP